MSKKGIFNPVVYNKKAGDAVEQATPIISVSESGEISASSTQEEGFVKKGVKLSTKQLPTREGVTVTPTREEQTIAEAGDFMKGAAKVAPIPEEYIVPSGSEEYTDNGAYDVRHLAKVTVNVKKDSEDPTPIVEQATPVISVSGSGLVTAEATQQAGIVAAGTKTTTYQLRTESGKTVTPTTEPQTVVEAGTFVKGDIVVDAVSNAGDEEPSEDLSAELSEQENRIYALGEKLGALAPTITINFVSIEWGESGEEYVPTTVSGSYSIDDGEAVSFDDAEHIVLPFVQLGKNITIYADLSSSADENGCTAEFNYDKYAMVVTPTSENASVKLYYY